MANYAERFKIERDSRLDLDALGSPAAIPSDTTEADVAAAVLVRKRVRSAILDAAEASLAVSTIPSSGPVRDAIAWARDVIASPDAASDQMLRLILARFDPLTPAQLLNPAITDETFRGAIDALIPALALGRDVRR